MTQNTLLLAIDQFDSGQAAIDFTIGFAGRSRADVRVFHVRELSRFLRMPPLETVMEAEALVDEAVLRLQTAGVKAEGRVRSGRENDIGHLVVEEATAVACNAIVLGSLRLRGAQRIANHGVRECVVQHTSLPVIITPTALSCRRLSTRSLTR
ncbi:MAG: universal stress protein [Acidimicrobiales bacterium]|jgi:nucleotide-binding universal stress UspA family protein